MVLVVYSYYKRMAKSKFRDVLDNNGTSTFLSIKNFYIGINYKYSFYNLFLGACV